MEDTGNQMEDAGNDLKELNAHMGDTKLATSHGIAAIALTLAMKYYQISTVQDGTLYQQYKLEGTNMTPLHLDMVFETAIQIERHLLSFSDRIAALVVDALATGLGDDEETEAE